MGRKVKSRAGRATDSIAADARSVEANALPFVTDRGTGVWVAVKAVPRAQRTEVVGTVGGELKVRIGAPPVDSAANEALMAYFSEILECPLGRIRLIRGAKNTHKMLEIQGLTSVQFAAKLRPFLIP